MSNAEPTLMSAAWRHRRLVLVVVGVVIAMAMVYQVVGPDEVTFEASANVVVQEPLPSDESGSVGDNDQFIRSQLEIIRSPVVAEAASEILGDAGIVVTADDLADAVVIVGTSDSPLVGITAQATSSEVAVANANAMADGYRRVIQRQASATSEARLDRIDAQVEGIDERLDEISSQISSMIADQPALESLRAQAQDSVGVIADLQIALLDAEGEEAADIRQQIQDHRQRIVVYAEIVATSAANPEQQALIEEQGRQVDRRATLLTLRDEIAVDAGLAPDAIALVQPAIEAERLDGLGWSRVLAVALLLGLALGVAIAYFLTTSRKALTHRSEPEVVIGARMLAEVPSFEAEHLESVVPVRDHPRSAAAEAYRFAATSATAAAQSQGITSIFVVSSTLGHGKTTTVVNMAAAAAIHGRSVLVVDCDFGNQESSRLLLGEAHMRVAGVTDVIEGAASYRNAGHQVDLGNGATLDVMPRGTRPSLAASSFQSKEARRLFADLADAYDLVFVDGPPLLQVAYASMLAELSQGVVVVVEHRGSHSQLADLANRLELIGTPVLGYVYNRSPLRREMTMSEGSMMDILGDSDFEPEVEEVSPTRSG